MSVELVDLGGSRSVPEGDPLRERASSGAPVALVVGGDPTRRARAVAQALQRGSRVAGVELGTEALAFHIGEGDAAPINVLGFARFRLGGLPASKLVELVRHERTAPDAIAALAALFQAAGLETAVCMDRPGRIVDRLLRPYLNAAMESVDEGLAKPADLDQALRLGLGFPKGPIELVESSGMTAHFAVSRALHEAIGSDGFLPSRRSRVEAAKKDAGLG